MRIVISLGGSVLCPDDPEFIGKIADLLKEASKTATLYIIIGGGKIARIYIAAARSFTKDSKKLDEIGILATKINALLLVNALNLPFRLPSTIDEAARYQPLMVMGGTTPGHSTDTVGAELAVRINADKFIIASNVNGVYTADPKIDKNAKKYDSIPIDDLIELCGKKWQPGKNIIVDSEACKVIKKGKIKTVVINGKDLNSLRNAIFNKGFDGTIIEV